MISQDEFERLINMSESSTLDFKTKMYDFGNDPDLKKTSKFVKDIISFSNTIRNEKAYIILGIEEKTDGSKEFHGLDHFIDDGILQDKVKDKVYPRPHFIFYILEYNSVKYGIIEFPIHKYSTPITPSIKMKGLDMGRIYYRQGTTNSEATGLEVIRINDWLRNLPDIQVEMSLNDEIGEQLKRLTANEEKLSVIIAGLFRISKKYNLTDLEEFCVSEINGVGKEKINEAPEKYKYRVHNVIISPVEFEINHNLYHKRTASDLKKEMENNEDFYDYPLLFNKSISEIEEYLDRIFNNSETSYGTLQMSSRQIFPGNDIKDYPVKVYLFEDLFRNLYRNIRQKAIDKLMDI